MGNPFEKFKKQLKQKNNIDDIMAEYGDEFSEELEADALNKPVVNEEDVEKMDLEPFDKSFQYVFFPKQDISTYDLARILAITQLMITPDIYEKFPKDLQRHFTTFTDLKN